MLEGYASSVEIKDLTTSVVYRAINRGKAIYRVSAEDTSDKHSMSKIPSVCSTTQGGRRGRRGESYLEILNIFIYDPGRVVAYVNVNELKWKFLEVRNTSKGNKKITWFVDNVTIG